MKLKHIAAAALLVTGVAASAQPPMAVRHVVVKRTIVTHTNRPAPRHKHCRTVWYRHAKVRRCSY